MVVMDMAGKTITRGRLPPRMSRGLRWARYLVITMEGLRFAEKWYHAEHVPPHIAKLYQLLLKLIRSKGVLAIGFVRSMGYGRKVIDQSLSSSYVKIVSRSSVLPDSVRDRIVEIIGEAPRCIYA